MQNTTDLLDKPSALDETIDELPPEVAALFEPEKTKKKRKRGAWLKAIFLIAALTGAGVWATNFTRHMLTHEETEDAYVTGHVHLVSPRVTGVAQEVLVDENQAVKRGQPLVRLD